MICDRVTIFRDGERITTEPIDKLSDEDVIRLMIGRPLGKYMRKHKTTIGDVALSVNNLGLEGAFHDISFEIRKGEIVGIGGLVGAGRTDVARAVFGIDIWNQMLNDALFGAFESKSKVSHTLRMYRLASTTVIILVHFQSGKITSSSSSGLDFCALMSMIVPRIESS